MHKTPLEEWVNRLGSAEIPAFTHTARQLALLSKDSDSCAADLAKVILSDPAMTAKVLRLANDALPPGSARSIETVSYAIVVLGYDKVRNIALTASMLETAIPSHLVAQAKLEIACAYHAALQAEAIATASGQQDTEDIYIAALLHRLGHIMLLCFPFECGEALKSDSGDPFTALEQNTLGFSLNNLTEQLLKHWRLSPLLQHALTQRALSDPKTACITHGSTIAECARHSWDTPDAMRQIVAISAFIGKSVKQTRRWLEENAQRAERQLDALGLKTPSPFNVHSNAAVAEADANKAAYKVVDLFSKHQVATAPHKDDKFARLYRELSELMQKQNNLSYYLLSLLEGMHKSCDSDQGCVLLYKGKEKQLILKQHLGNRAEALADKFISAAQADAHNFGKFFDPDQASLWQRSDKVISLNKDDLTRLNFMTHPVKVFGQHLGYIAVVKMVDSPFGIEDFQRFQRLGELGNLAFRQLIERKG